MFFKQIFTVLLLITDIVWTKGNGQIGPDPWDYESNINSIKRDDVPPDLIAVPSKKVQSSNIGTGEWFYKRILAIVLKGGVIKKNEDGSVDISLQMRYSLEQWNILAEYMSSNTVLSEDMLRRSMGYVEEAIYKPTITEKIAMAWSEYVQFYLIEFKIYIVWITSILAVIGTTFWLWRHLSKNHIIILMLVAFYLYEVFVSYKEAEKQELDRFVNAMDSCKWRIWSSTCEVPPPDLLIFLKHMNPLKIGIRMFSIVLSEPIITISDTVKTITHGLTDGLWYPFDKIMYGILMLTFNALLIFLLIIIFFNFILNIPFKLSFLGIFSIGVKQRNRSFPISDNNSNTSAGLHRGENIDRISGETLSKLLDVCSKALNTKQSPKIDSTNNGSNHNSKLQLTYNSKMSRSASTGRLPNYVSNERQNK